MRCDQYLDAEAMFEKGLDWMVIQIQMVIVTVR